jgi:exoribonuclease-2
MPGFKVTMLPDAVVQTYTLREGRDCPAVSLYVTMDEQTLEISATETRIERVPIAANLRHDQLDQVVTPQWLQQPEFQHAPGTDPLAPDMRAQLAFLYRVAEHLKAQRIQVRGKPETFNRPDYNFRLVGGAGVQPEGHEQVQISVRQRGAPLDLIVAEAMILANSTWGNWMAELGVPGIYRSQASLAPGVKVRMGTRALPHAGIGVPSYAWSTSPLRRYTDLVNQWQIIACARHGRTAALAAPFKPKDAELFSIISGFDAAYAAYGAFQGAMERFWTLQYLMQNQITELDAAVFKENMVRAESLPLVLMVAGARDLPRGARVRVRLGDIDSIALDVSGTVVERLDAAAQEVDAGSDDEGDEDAIAGPIAIAVDMGEGTDARPEGGDNPDS